MNKNCEAKTMEKKDTGKGKIVNGLSFTISTPYREKHFVTLKFSTAPHLKDLKYVVLTKIVNKCFASNQAKIFTCVLKSISL